MAGAVPGVLAAPGEIMPGVQATDLLHVLESAAAIGAVTTTIGIIALRALARSSIGSMLALIAAVTVEVFPNCIAIYLTSGFSRCGVRRSAPANTSSGIVTTVFTPTYCTEIVAVAGLETPPTVMTTGCPPGGVFGES